MIVLDASALLALINNEPGADVASRAAAANDATISSVNYAEVLQEIARLGVAAEDVDAELDALSVTVSHLGRLGARFGGVLLPRPLGPQPGRSGLSGPGPQLVEPGPHR